MKQKIELTEVIDEEVSFFQVKNEVMQEYYPLIGASGFALYSFYKSMANRAAGNRAFPSYELVRKHLGMATSTTNRYNWLLEQCGLIRIIKGNARANNVYRLLKVTPATPEILVKLTQALQPIETDGKEWTKFKAAVLEAVQNWQPLRAYFKPRSESPAPVDTPPQSDLVAQLVEMFAENNLSETAAEKMIADYGEEAVKQQLEWLPARQSDTPLRILRAALKGNWREPKAVGKSAAETFTAAEMAVMTARMNEANESAPAPDPLWQEVKERLHMQLTQATFDSCVRQTELVSIEGNQWLIQCGSTSAQEWLENRLNGTLTRTASSVAGQAVELKFIVMV